MAHLYKSIGGFSFLQKNLKEAIDEKKSQSI